MRFQADHPLRPDHGIVSCTRRKFEPVARVQCHAPLLVRHSKCDRACDDVDDFVVGAARRRIVERFSASAS